MKAGISCLTGPTEQRLKDLATITHGTLMQFAPTADNYAQVSTKIILFIIIKILYIYVNVTNHTDNYTYICVYV